MDRSTKEKQVASLHQNLTESSLAVVTRQVGLSVAEATDLRLKMREADASYKVIKNTLARIAVKGTNFEDLEPFFKGPMALATSSDPVAAAKVAVNFSNDNDKLSIVGGILNGKVLNENEIKQLAKLPSLDELRSQLIAVISAPATQIARIVKIPAEQVARVCSAYGNS
ncbi:MAG: 50S ribosomal protein L10 [Alphaproteobacteria bacterium]|nr:50S ribosomal protein L10 [Alphaproteobacteria bacterium]MBT5389716.1 50S ribosomal protein L10 [Alphaproteobacteria bacterium]MBT5654636.1 50S ribosomal protein L10 [Alphaproteobacteria bacterium]